MKNTNLTEGSIAKGFILFALPLFLGSLFQQLYGTVDLIFVGNYMGKTEAAAVGASGILVTCLIGLFTGISVGAGVITAQYWGAKDKENVQKSMENALFSCISRRNFFDGSRAAAGRLGTSSFEYAGINTGAGAGVYSDLFVGNYVHDCL